MAPAYCTALLAQRRTRGGVASRTHFLPRACNISTTSVNIVDVEAVKNALAEERTKFLYFESISSSTLSVANIPELSRIAHDKGVTVVVDNTFAPLVLSPAALGADVVVPDAVCAPFSLVNSMMDLRQVVLLLLGPTMNPKVAFELPQRIPRLSMRMKEHCHLAMAYAAKMKKLNLKVIYPGLEDLPQHPLLKSMANKDYGFGGLVSVGVETEERANRLMHHLRNCTHFVFMAVSLGYYGTLMSCSLGAAQAVK